MCSRGENLACLGALLTLVFSSACQFDESGLWAVADGGEGVVDSAAADASSDSSVDSAAADAAADALPVDGSPADAFECVPWTWNPTNFDECDPSLPDPQATIEIDTIGTWVFDSGMSELWPPTGPPTTLASAVLTQPGGVEVRVVPAFGLTVGAGSTLEVSGVYPVIFAVYGSANISGTIDASAKKPLIGDSTPGPGADPAACSDAGDGEPATATDSGGGGGGGGGYGGDGGDGGDGAGGGKGAKGGKGSQGGTTDLRPLRGGCSGGAGGDADQPSAGTGGIPGHGGGAVQLSIRDSLAVYGAIRAAGTGGDGGGGGIAGGHAGAGGGGSGGAILLEADDLTVASTASVCANGGSGGEGADPNVAGPDGVRGTCSENDGASTLNILSDGGDGGDGGYRSDVNGGNAGNGGGQGGGGGGGGGGAGRTRLRGVSSSDIDSGATLTPAALLG